MSDKKEAQECCARTAEERKNDEYKKCDNNDDDRMVFPDEKQKPTLENRNIGNSNPNPGYGTDANGEIVNEF